MNFTSFIIKFIKFKPIIKFKKFELHNYGSSNWWAPRMHIPNGILIGSAVLQDSRPWLADRQTSSHTTGRRFVCNSSPHLELLLRCCSVLLLSRPRSEGWPHRGHTFSISVCPLSFWLTLPRTVLSTSWCCPSRLCVVFLACVHLALFLASSLSPGNTPLFPHVVTIASLLWQCLAVPSLLQLS